METTIQKIDKLRTMLTTSSAKRLLSEIRKEVKLSETASGKYATYMSDTLDGIEPEDALRYFNGE